MAQGMTEKAFTTEGTEAGTESFSVGRSYWSVFDGWMAVRREISASKGEKGIGGTVRGRDLLASVGICCRGRTL